MDCIEKIRSVLMIFAEELVEQGDLTKQVDSRNATLEEKLKALLGRIRAMHEQFKLQGFGSDGEEKSTRRSKCLLVWSAERRLHAWMLNRA